MNLITSRSFLTRKDPHEGLTDIHIIRGILWENLQPVIPPDCLYNYEKLVLQCGARDPAKRFDFPTIFQILSQLENEVRNEPQVEKDQSSEIERLKKELEMERAIRANLENQQSNTSSKIIPIGNYSPKFHRISNTFNGPNFIVITQTSPSLESTTQSDSFTPVCFQLEITQGTSKEIRSVGNRGSALNGQYPSSRRQRRQING